MKVALVYDRVNKWGGAESVLLAIHEIWPEAPLYTSIYSKSTASWADAFDVRTTFLQTLPLPKDAHEYYPFLMGPAFETLCFDEYDVVITLTHEFAKAVLTKPKTLHVCYCLTPTGYLWSGYDQYFSSKGKIFKIISNPVVEYLRFYDKIISNRPDEYLAISRVVQERIKKYYNRESEIIYPPVSIFPAKSDPRSKSGDYFLVVARLVGNKRIDLVVKAFNHLGWPLKIVGRGREGDRLKSQAKRNIEFLGGLTAEDLAGYYRNCRALVVPGEEDFGIVALEAQSFGRPVIAFGKGGALETVSENKTGWFFGSQTEESLVSKLIEVNHLIEKINPRDCVANSRKYEKRHFQAKFKAKIEKLCMEKCQ